MKKILYTLLLYCFSLAIGHAQSGTITVRKLPNADCNLFKSQGIAPLLQNKTWQMTKMYLDSIPLHDSLPDSYQFVFKADSVQNADSLILFVIRKVGTNEEGSAFKYTINQSTNIISLFHGADGTFQKAFKVVCLTPGHLAFTFVESGKDGQGNPKTFAMEYRFLVDYTWEYSRLSQH